MKGNKVLVVVTMLAMLAMVVSCAAPTPEVIEKEVIVTRVVEKEVVVTEIVEVEGEERIVEVTKIVQEIVEVPVEVAGGGTLRRASLLNWDGNFNPFHWKNITTEEVYSHVFNALVRWDSDLSGIIPELAESWDVSEDGKVYTFHLQEGVLWHDGKPFTAEDVEFTLLRHLHPDMASQLVDSFLHITGAEAYSTGEASTVPGIQVIDDHTISLETTDPYAPFLSTLAITMITPKHVLEDVLPEDMNTSDFSTRSPIGTGPYKVVRYIPDESIEFVRNTDYFRGIPHIERVLFTQTAREVMVSALLNEEIDVAQMWGNTTQDMQMLQEEGFQIETPTWGFWSFYCNTDQPYLNDEICQAMLYAIDAETISREVHSGMAEVMPTYLDHPWYGLSPDLNWYEYDPEKARTMLEEAGYDFDRELDAVLLQAPDSPQVVMVTQWLEDVGIKLNIVHVGDGATWRERVPIGRDWDILPIKGRGWGPDPDNVRLGFTCDMGWPKSEKSTDYCNPYVDELFDRALVTVDEEERAEIYRELQLILNKEGGDFPLVRGVTGHVASPRVRDARLGFRGFTMPYDALHEWWLAEE